MKKYIIGVLLFLIPSFSAGAQIIDDATLEKLKSITEIERTYVLKVAENNLTKMQIAMFEDQENVKDTFLWAKKVTSFHYAHLWSLSRNLSLYTLGAFYLEKSDIISANIRGDVSMMEFVAGEKQIEAKKTAFLDSLISDTAPPPKLDIQHFNALSAAIAESIHGASVIAAQK